MVCNFMRNIWTSTHNRGFILGIVKLKIENSTDDVGELKVLEAMCCWQDIFLWQNRTAADWLLAGEQTNVEQHLKVELKLKKMNFISKLF